MRQPGGGRLCHEILLYALGILPRADYEVIGLALAYMRKIHWKLLEDL